MDLELFNLIIDTLIMNGYNIKEIETVKAVIDRKNGKSFCFEDHIAGMVYALLSNQRPWKQISDNYDLIRDIFHSFNPYYLQNVDPSLFVKEIRNIKCGNRSINSQMFSLSYNIDIFKKIISIYGSMDSYVTSDDPLIIANSFASGNFKLKQMGLPLVLEYLKNVGIDAVKPDTHIRRLFGKDRLSFSDKELATEKEVLSIVKELSNMSNLSMVEIDSIIWQFCASNYANICGSIPKCDKCLLRTRCNYKKI